MSHKHGPKMDIDMGEGIACNQYGHILIIDSPGASQLDKNETKYIVHVQGH